jgi:NAD(P)-dependent dehydrogenase (short-subunit alcohol dehydrogenase family)
MSAPAGATAGAPEHAIVAGVGPGLGWHLVQRFAAAGMRVTMAARNLDRLQALLAAEPLAGVTPVACDVTDEASVQALFAGAGAPDLVVFNAGTFVPGGLLELDAAAFERCWRIGCHGGFLVGQASARAMLPRGSGTILFTGATASLRGSARFSALAVPKFGLRALAQSMARELGPQGIHVAHVVIDGQIGRQPGGAPGSPAAERHAGRPAATMLDPAAIAEVYYQLHRQPPTTWTQELDLRPATEKF